MTFNLRFLIGGDILLPVVSVVGNSGSGKTTFLEKLIPEMKSRGYKIATIKHGAHDFEIDKPGEDSWKHRKAGAQTVLLSSQAKMAMIKELNQEIDLDTLIQDYINKNIDLVITEGYKAGDKFKIEVFRPAKFDTPLFSKDDDNILTIVRNSEKIEGSFSVSQIKEVANLIEERVIK